jgi:hypothetical protein
MTTAGLAAEAMIQSEFGERTRRLGLFRSTYKPAEYTFIPMKVTVRTPTPTRVSGGMGTLAGTWIVFGKAIEVAGSTVGAQ